MEPYDIVDRAALALGGGLMLLGIVVLGVVETFTGQPYGASPLEQTNEAGEVVNTLYPTVDPVIRTGLVIAGLLVLLLWGIYRMARTTAEDAEARTVESVAD